MSDFIKSDNCTECEGDGYVWLRRENKKEQCESCEELHRMEARADRLEDEWKGN